ncbi:hypothetical protein RhiirA1_510816 [Rhizophagus irregularis]|uniref:Uncharacterized protein n=2 Tax=Rhizophagus irregularis TaxID=588596 RepID=A0A2N0QQU5_9GLOM|nr:hypothetical protein RhiirA1_510816 [Rhizophagus irregularis]
MNPANNDELFNKYEILEGNLVADEDLVDKDKVFYTYDENYEDISDIENNNNDEPLFELDFNTLTKVKQFTQQNTSDEEDENITSDTESNFSESESDEEHDEIITQLKDKQELSPCVIIDVFEGKIQRCNSTTNLRRLWQMVGMWQIDEEEIKKKHFSIKNLGVCYTHFMFDQNKLHITNLKQTKDYTESIIHRRRCLFCNKNKFFFSRGKNCIHHSYIVMGKNIQVPCIGQKKCGALQEYHPLGGHVYQRVGRGVKEDPNCDNMSHHENDIKEILEAIGHWILNIATSEKSMWQKKVLIHLVHVITQLNQEKSNNTSDILIPLADTKTEIPSLFIILIILALMKFNYNLDKKLNPKNLTPKNFFEFGEALAHSTILAKNELKLHKKSLESPISIEEYRASFPLCLVQFYNGLLETLYKTKKKIID